jgi:hypothetical protein
MLSYVADAEGLNGNAVLIVHAMRLVVGTANEKEGLRK